MSISLPSPSMVSYLCGKTGRKILASGAKGFWWEGIFQKQQRRHTSKLEKNMAKSKGHTQAQARKKFQHVWGEVHTKYQPLAKNLYSKLIAAVKEKRFLQ